MAPSASKLSISSRKDFRSAFHDRNLSNYSRIRIEPYVLREPTSIHHYYWNYYRTKHAQTNNEIVEGSLRIT